VSIHSLLHAFIRQRLLRHEPWCAALHANRKMRATSERCGNLNFPSDCNEVIPAGQRGPASVLPV